MRTSIQSCFYDQEASDASRRQANERGSLATNQSPQAGSGLAVPRIGRVNFILKCGSTLHRIATNSQSHRRAHLSAGTGAPVRRSLRVTQQIQPYEILLRVTVRQHEDRRQAAVELIEVLSRAGFGAEVMSPEGAPDGEPSVADLAS
jgi:hypothetical protein